MCTEKIYSGEKESEKSHLYIPFYHSLIHSVSICWAFSKSQLVVGQSAMTREMTSLLYSSTVHGYHWVKLGKRPAEVRILITSRRHDSRVKGFRLKSDSLLMVRNINLQQTLAYTLASSLPSGYFPKCHPITVERKSARVTTLWFWDGASARSTGSGVLYSAAAKDPRKEGIRLLFFEKQSV